MKKEELVEPSSRKRCAKAPPHGGARAQATATMGKVQLKTSIRALRGPDGCARGERPRRIAGGAPADQADEAAPSEAERGILEPSPPMPIACRNPSTRPETSGGAHATYDFRCGGCRKKFTLTLSISERIASASSVPSAAPSARGGLLVLFRQDLAQELRASARIATGESRGPFLRRRRRVRGSGRGCPTSRQPETGCRGAADGQTSRSAASHPSERMR